MARQFHIEYDGRLGAGWSTAVRTIEVTREFFERTDELAKTAKIPEIRERLSQFADRYRQKLAELEGAESGSIAPK